MEKREHWNSNFGFIMASAGAAVGLGNLWKFPYLAGMNGGGLFLLAYLLLLGVLGIPILMAEMSVGRYTQQNAIGAYRVINKKWSFVGAIGILCGFIILSYYSVVGGWVLKYLSDFVFQIVHTDPVSYFEEFVAQPVEPILWHLLFMVITVLVVMAGVTKGIEKISKILLPALFVLIIVLMIQALTLPGAEQGVRFFLYPDFTMVQDFQHLSHLLLQAMGQVFFSLSLGMGTIITYGSYLKKESNIQKNASIIPALDTLVAVFAGLLILPAVFSFGYEPQAGPGLVFQTLPKIFQAMTFGNIFGLLFFLMVLFAAVTSSISLLEVVAAFLIDTFSLKRVTATVLPAIFMFLIGCIASLSFGPLKDISFFGMNFFDFLTFVSDKLLMPIGGFFMCIFVGHVWKVKNAVNEITNNGQLRFRGEKLFSVVIRYIAPAIILIVFISSFIS